MAKKAKQPAKKPAVKAKAARAKRTAALARKPALAPRGPSFIPDGYHTVTPYLVVRGAAKAIDFYVQAFGAREVYRLPAPGGMVGHAELMIGNSRIMLADEMPEWGSKSPHALGGTALGLCIYVKDCDATYQQALGAGASTLRPLQDQFYGDRSGQVLDPYGHQWTIATHLEDVTPREMQRRMEAGLAQPPPPPPDALTQPTASA